MEQLIELGVFLGKFAIVFVFIVALTLLIASLALRARLKPDLEIECINDKLDELEKMLSSVLMDKKSFKNLLKDEKKRKTDEKLAVVSKRKQVFVLQFDGDIKASAVDQLRDEITAILTVAEPEDEVVIKIESPGGTAHGYGLAAAQILRLKKAQLNVVAAVDKVAASGGYMMACTAHKIIAAPFAILGSIGVLAQVPNFHKLLKKHDVDYEEISSGEYKRTVSVLGEITDKGRAKFLEQIVDTHQLFKQFVSSERPSVKIDQVATGEYWFGLRAKEMALVDEIMTSDEYLLSQRDSAKIYKIKFTPKKKLSDKLSELIGQAAERAASRIYEKIMEKPIL